MAHAERLFASEGIHAVTNRQIIDAAEQKNVSALNYHFGSRDDLLLEILRSHGELLDMEREKWSDSLDDLSSTRDIVHALMVPYGEKLLEQRGRYYLLIVDQLRAHLGIWRRGVPSVDTHLQRLLELLVSRPTHLSAELREHRLISMMMLMTAAMAARAREVDEGGDLSPGPALFLASLTDMLVGIIDAPATPPDPTANYRSDRRSRSRTARA